ncbi:polysaccharide deacetylase family protein [Staphylococcus hominis]|uniref:polysaccharide deacetylase family protein n=1 Tax=Staphylococcus hominis TaxID=1290 RepID=UPI00019FC705|nr:polysaccharide deacetylase family protein [Staphylococcus hominis]AYY66367.1 polysaccharide deacetylase [Staphylococcus hominis]EEK11852.1 polysaccharide deacetylase [Staphylococcus hominis SK119]EFS20479.1 putative lipoprotein [Staphylococcus hominis subsp. hominis C80]MCC3737971.1 polysaccharide deacetylase family protein [Staphylococcus hominis]MCI2838615.1 polysaccharide deacetylase family protein [Staphylococcus hominis]
MTKTYLLSTLIVLISIVLCACQFSTLSSSKKDTKKDKENIANIYAKKSTQNKKDWQVYQGDIAHVFYHPVITEPKVAFTQEKNQAKGNFDWMITADEFKRSLNELYKHHYILIDPHEAYDLKGKTITRKELKLPKGKKPLILSIDDMNYYEYMRGHGYADRLVLDQKQHVVSETKDKNGKVTTSETNDIVPILNQFVKDHPDFSLNGQKGVVALTGYNGVLGYRTNELNNKDYLKRKKDAEKVVKAMKRDGWTFASHSWGHIDFANSSYDQIVRDTKRWKNEVEPIIGKTDVFIYPHGAQDRGSKAYQYLVRDEGFKFLAGVGPNNFTDIGNDSVYQDRVAIDGLNLYDFKYKLKPFLDPSKVYSETDRQYFKGDKSYQ